MKSFSSYMLAKPKTLSVLFSFSLLLSLVSIASASTTISTDINTEGTLTVTGAGASSITNFLGLGTISPSSLLTIKGTTTTAILGSELIIATADQNFSSDTTKWTGTGWTIGSNVITHTAGANALTLDNSALSSAPVSGNVYQITFTVVTTVAGTLTPSIGGVNGVTIGQLAETVTESQVITTANTGALTFTPDATWTGTIDDVSVKQITNTSALVKIQNSDGTAGLEMRSGGTELNNTFIGISAGQSSISGTGGNVAVGNGALQVNTIGYGNTANGYQALHSNTTGLGNTANGYQALYSNIGLTGQANTTGSYNTATGYQALNANTKGFQNVGNGAFTLWSNTTGSQNMAVGYAALKFNTTGNDNTANGWKVLTANTTGIRNTATGYGALMANTTGSYNMAYGSGALNANTTGNFNTAIGLYTGGTIISGSYNILIGSYVTATSSTATGQLNIGNLLFGTGVYGGGGGIMSYAPVADGKIGVGTTTPYGLFSVEQGTETASLWVGNTGSSTPSLMVNGVNGNGKVGIGTTSPAVSLDVNGYVKTLLQATSTDCIASTRGSTFYNQANDSFWGCKSSGWVRLDN